MVNRKSQYLEDFMKAEVARMHALDALARMEEREGRTKRKALAEVLEIDDPAVLDQLMDLEMCASTVVAFSLVPMVAVAWADWEIQKKEREAILKAAAEHGITEGTLAYDVLSSWLEKKLKSEVYEAWKDYTKALVAKLDDAARAQLKESTLGRARVVAEAAGGFLGFGSKISAEEQAKLDDLEKAFS